MPPTNRRGSARAPALPFFLRVQQELVDQGLSQKDLLLAAGVQPSTFNLLGSSPPRDLVTRKNTVLRIARVLGIPDVEALQLAGLPTPHGEKPAATPEDAIARLNEVDPAFLDEEQKGLLEDMILMFVRRNEQAQERDGDYGPDQTA